MPARSFRCWKRKLNVFRTGCLVSSLKKNWWISPLTQIAGESVRILGGLVVRQVDRLETMELDWYSNRLSANAVLTPTPSLRWMSNFGDSDKQCSPRWLSFRNMMPDRKAIRGFYSVDEYSPPGSNVSSPKEPEIVQFHRLAGDDDRCPIDSPRSSSLSPTSPKSHVCFGCVLHSHE